MRRGRRGKVRGRGGERVEREGGLSGVEQSRKILQNCQLIDLRLGRSYFISVEPQLLLTFSQLSLKLNPTLLP